MKSILLVEDDTEIGPLLWQVITEEAGYGCTLVSDGLQALDVVKQDTPPDLFILDYRLPIMNGLDLYTRLHTTAGLEHVPALIISATLPKQELLKRDIIGMEKPLDLDDFLRTVESLMTVSRNVSNC